MPLPQWCTATSTCAISTSCGRSVRADAPRQPATRDIPFGPTVTGSRRPAPFPSMTGAQSSVASNTMVPSVTSAGARGGRVRIRPGSVGSDQTGDGALEDATTGSAVAAAASRRAAGSCRCAVRHEQVDERLGRQRRQRGRARRSSGPGRSPPAGSRHIDTAGMPVARAASAPPSSDSSYTTRSRSITTRSGTRSTNVASGSRRRTYRPDPPHLVRRQIRQLRALRRHRFALLGREPPDGFRETEPAGRGTDSPSVASRPRVPPREHPRQRQQWVDWPSPGRTLNRMRFGLRAHRLALQPPTPVRFVPCGRALSEHTFVSGRPRSFTPTSTASSRRSSSATTPACAAARSGRAASSSPRATRPRRSASLADADEGAPALSRRDVVRRGPRPIRRRARPSSRSSRTRHRMVEALSIDEAFLDVTGLRRVSGRTRADRRPAEGTDARASVCRSPSVSRGRSSWPRSRAGSRSPTGCWRSNPNGSWSSCIPCRSRLWGVGPVTSNKLHAKGIGTVGEVRDPRRDAARRDAGQGVGPSPASLAHNFDPRPVQARRRRRSMGSQHRWPASRTHANSTASPPRWSTG